jgi:uncharacterized Ntn-hydrolase superfamily protein
VARDPATGDLGIAVQSALFAIGTTVPWIEAGAGAIATQGFCEGGHGFHGLRLLREGRSATEALAALLSPDEGRDLRQLAIVDVEGRVAAHTGTRCFPMAGHVAGDGWAAVSSLARSSDVWPAMGRAFESAAGDLALRLLAALDAAEAAGGELRGRRSAALLVVRGASSGRPWMDGVFDVRVDDAPEPLVELRRLVALQTAYNHLNAAQKSLERGDLEGALVASRKASSMFPTIAELTYWPALVLVLSGRLEEALPGFREAFRREPAWVEVTRRLPAIGLLPDDPELIGRIVAGA